MHCRYDNADIYYGRTVCSFDQTMPYYYLWTGVTLVVPVAICTIFLFVLSAKLWWRVRLMNSQYQLSLVKAVVLYPVVGFLFCAPVLGLFIYQAMKAQKVPLSPEYTASPTFLTSYTRVQSIIAFFTLQGLLNSIVFFANSAEARERWSKLFQVYFGCCFRKNDEQADVLRLSMYSTTAATDFLDDNEMMGLLQEQLQRDRGSTSRRSSRSSHAYPNDSKPSSARPSFNDHAKNELGDGIEECDENNVSSRFNPAITTNALHDRRMNAINDIIPIPTSGTSQTNISANAPSAFELSLGTPK